MTPNRRAMAYTMLFVACWATVEALAARLQRAYSPYQVVFTRYAVHLAFLAAVWGLREPASLWRTRRPAFQLGRSLLMLAMPASFVLAAQRGVPVGSTLALFWLSPLLVLALSRPVLGEPASAAAWAVTGLACAGAIALVRPQPWGRPALAVLPLAMAGTFALYVAMTRDLRAERTRTNLFYTALGVAAALAPAMPRLWVTPSVRDGAVMGAIGLLGLAALWALDRAAAAAPVSATAAVLALQVVFAVGIEVVLRHAHLGARAAAALPFIACAALLAWVRAPALTAEETP